jgi:DNA polymerase alpha subunit A
LRSQVVKTKADDDFLSNLLGEVDSNIPAPAPHISRVERSGGRRKARALSPAPEPIPKKKKTFDTRMSSPPAPAVNDDDGFFPPGDDDLLETADVPMSDPAPSSPAAKVAQRKAQVKQEPNEDDDEDMMEVAHAGAIATASVNLASSRPIKKILKAESYPALASSSPVKANGAQVDSTSWNALTERLNVVSSSPSEAKTIGKIDYKDAIEEDGSLNFFWTDYTEVNGNLCLFGKVLNKKTRSYVSCFVKVDNILRKLYFLPREHRLQDGEETGEEVEMMHVYDEIDTLMTKMNVGMYKIKACTRKYAFELRDVPKEAQYMKLLYPYTSEPQLLLEVTLS